MQNTVKKHVLRRGCARDAFSFYVAPEKLRTRFLSIVPVQKSIT